MIHILAIAPYEGLKNIFETSRASHPDISMTVHVGDLNAAIELVQQTDILSYDVAISRGGTAELLKQALEIPVVEVSFSVFDMLRATQLAAGSHQRYAIVGFSAMTACAHSVLTLQPDSQVTVREIHSQEEAGDCLQALKNEGYSLVVGDTVIARLAQAYGMSSILVTSGRESVETAIDNACELCRIIQKQTLTSGIFTRLWEMNRQYALVLSQQGDTAYCNMPADMQQLFYKKLSPEIPAVLEGGSPIISVHYGRQQYAIRTSSLSVQDQRYAVFCAQPPVVLPDDNDAFIRCYDRGQELAPDYNTLTSIQSAAGKELLKSIDAMALQQLPVLVRGEQGLAKRAVIAAIHNASSLGDSPLFVIDAKKGTAKKWKALLDNCDSPIYHENYGICFRNIQCMQEDSFGELLQCILTANIHRRNRLYFSCTITSDYPDETNRRWEEVIDRLGCLTLMPPPLRSRTEDIPSLATLYVSEMNVLLGKQVVGFEEKALAAMQHYPWYRNFAQLRQVIREAVATADGFIITVQHLQPILDQHMRDGMPAVAPESVSLPLEDVIKNHILSVLEKEDGNQTRAAQVLGISRGTLWRRLSEYESA